MRIAFLISSIAFQERYNLTNNNNNMAPPHQAETVAVQVDEEIYGKSGDLDKHMEGVKAQYDTKEKLEFYAQVMGDGTANIHFGKWDGESSTVSRNVDLSPIDKKGHEKRSAELTTRSLTSDESPSPSPGVNLDEEGAYGKASEQMTGRNDTQNSLETTRHLTGQCAKTTCLTLPLSLRGPRRGRG